MSISPIERNAPRARTVTVSDRTLPVELVDGRSISVPVDWFPRLAHGTDRERANWRLGGRGEGIRWPDLDEDIEVDALLSGHRSTESKTSIERWLRSRIRS
jgi:hypothetical protein